MALLPAPELVRGMIQHLRNEAEGGFMALFFLHSVVSTLCQCHVELLVFVDVFLLAFWRCVVVALVASLSFWRGFSWTSGHHAGVARDGSPRVRRRGT